MAPNQHSVGRTKCEISPCSEKPTNIVVFEKKIGGKYTIKGSAYVCDNHVKNWPTRTWGKFIKATKRAQTPTKNDLRSGRVPFVPNQYRPRNRPQ